MDEQPGKVIDGTARARHWRRSQPKSAAERDGSQQHSEAPKSIASSLLVPPTMPDGELASPLNYEPATDNGAGSSPAMDGTKPDRGHRNIFLSPDAAVPIPPRRRSTQHIPTAALRLVRRASIARRRIADVRRLRAEFSVPRAGVAAVVALAAVCGVAAALAVGWQSASAPRSRSVAHADVSFGFDRLKERFLLAESAFAAVQTKTQPGTSVTRPAARRSVRRVRQVRVKATRVATPYVASTVASASRPTPTTSDAAAVAASASRAPSTAAGGATPAQQSPTSQTQLHPVHYQPPSPPAGPEGLGSQVGNSCNPKCS